MQQNELFSDEKIITQSDGNLITLTDYRIRYTDKEWGRAYIISILLRNVSSIQIRSRSRWYFFVIGVLILLFSLNYFLFSYPGVIEGIIGLVVGSVFIYLYLRSRKHYLTISSNGGNDINFFIQDMKQETVIDFVNRVEKAMLNT